MISAIEKKWVQFLIVLGTVSVALVLSPSFSSEPVDLPKLFILVVFAGVILGSVAKKLRILTYSKYRIISIVVGLFVLQLTVVLLLSGAPFNQQFFGTSGRNTGYLAYISLAIVLIASTLVSDPSLLQKLTKWLFICGIATAIYGFLQITKHDLIKWNNPYNPIIAFLGNPDFASAFLGISATAGFALLIKSGQKTVYRILVATYQVFALYLVIKSHAQQGVLVYSLSAGLVLIIFLYSNNKFNRLVVHGISGLLFILGSVTVLGIFKIGPLASHLYKYSVRQRGFYWHAAIEMMKSHPAFGIGLDSYGDNYFRYRSANAGFISISTQSNAAHNVYLDLASGGGVPLFLLYVLLNFFVVFYGIRALKAMQGFNPYLVTAFVAWVGYQAQSIVSINNLGLAIWGWVLGGAVLGFAINSNSTVKSETLNSGRKKVKNQKIDFISPTIGLVGGLLLALPPFMADHNYRTASATQNANAVIAAASAYPEDLGRSLSIAQILASAKLYPQALALVKHVSEISPKNYNAWVLISQLTQPGSAEHTNAILNMQQQNPHDKSIK
jgi:O-antigen ligase